MPILAFFSSAALLQSITITTQPSKTVYWSGESFDTSGMVVTATYTDGTTAAVTGYTTAPGTLSTLGAQAITVSYAENGVTKTATVSVTVRGKITATPSQSGSLTYTGSTLTPSWSNYDSTKLSIGGTTSSVNAGSFTATFTPKTNYAWSDGTTTAKNVSWTIAKAAGSLSISPTSMTLDTSNTSRTISVTRAGNGTITATSSNTSVATVSVSGTTVTVRSVNNTNGSATITVKVAAGTNHTAPANKTCLVTASFIPTLNDASWAYISEASSSGKAANYWSVGDRKAVKLSGKVGIRSFSNETYCCYIIGFNHNSAKEGSNRIHFNFGFTELVSGTNIAFTDAQYENGLGFSMNKTSTTSGGWNSCYMRSTLCPAFKSVLPSDLQNVLKTTTKYTDNKGGASTSDLNINGTTDSIFLMSELEVIGSIEYSNPSEGLYQLQYDYYKNGNAIEKFRDTETTKESTWYLRSPSKNNYSKRFCCISRGGAAEAICEYSVGFSPCFCV